MKKQNLLLLLSASLILASCTDSKVDSSESSADSSDSSSSVVPTPSVETDRIDIKDIPSVEQGTTVDLKDYVSVKGTATSQWTYTLLTDSVHDDIVSVEENDGPSLYESTKLLALRPGRVNFRVEYGDASATGYFDVTLSSALKTLSDKIGAMDLTNYTVTKNFSIDENYRTVDADPTTLIYKGQNYIYYPDSYYGEVINQATNLGYYYQLNGVEDKYASSFKAMTNADKTALSAATFNATYANLSTYFNADNMRYYSVAKEYVGEPYALCYESSSSTVFRSALSALGLTYSHKVNSTTFYTIALVPKFVNDTFQLYAISITSAGLAVIEGPYVLSNVGSTTIAAVEAFASQEVPMTYYNNDSIVTRFTGIESLTATLEGHYEDLDGNKIDVPEYFASALPEVNSEIKWNDTYFYSNMYNYIDGGDDEKVLLANELVSGKEVVNRYVLNDAGAYTAKEVMSSDPTNGAAISDWQNGKTFRDTFLPVSFLPTTSWKYAAVEELDDGKCFLAGFNDSISKNLISYFLSGLSASKLFGTSSAFLYFGIYSTMEMNIGSQVTDPISGDMYTRVIKTSTNEYWVYHATFNVTNINNTVITAPVQA